LTEALISQALSNVITVAASDRRDRLAWFSNYGAQSVDIAAPGSQILSTLPGGGYGYKSGTSMATAQVTAVIAMVWAKNPGWGYRTITTRVLDAANRMPSLNGKVASGRLNAERAMLGKKHVPIKLLVTVGPMASIGGTQEWAR
jgi:subtilisin family serine protease